MGFGQSCMRLILFVFNFLYLCIGGAALGFGIWAQVKKNAVLFGMTRNELVPIVLIVIGAIVVLISLTGFCGAVKMSKGCLLFYAGILTVLLLVELGLALTGYFLRKKIKKAVDRNIVNYLQNDYPKLKYVKAFIDSSQESWKCCGYYNYTDWSTSKWRKMPENSALAVPATCCVKPVSPTSSCNAANERGDIKDKSKIHPKGCEKTIKDFAEKHLKIILIVVCCVAVIQMLGVILSCCLMSSADAPPPIQ